MHNRQPENKTMTKKQPLVTEFDYFSVSRTSGALANQRYFTCSKRILHVYFAFAFDGNGLVLDNADVRYSVVFSALILTIGYKYNLQPLAVIFTQFNRLLTIIDFCSPRILH